MSPDSLGGASLGSAVVLSVSNRAAAGVYDDTTGPRIVSALQAWGFDPVKREVVPDGAPVEAALRDSVAAGASVVITTGGTGINPHDETPEMTMRVLDKEICGIAEAIRAYGTDRGIATASLSRGVAGIAGSTLVVNVPGSVGGVKDALAVLGPILPHAVDQLRGGDHTKAEDDGAGADNGGTS
jgi:molybdenum cofactor synthesis domain-containing protein